MLMIFRSSAKRARHASGHTPDSWSGIGGFYIARFRQPIEKIAAELSTLAEPAVTRFNPEQKCAEIHVGGRVLAQVRVEGSEHVPYRTRVALASLDETTVKPFLEKGLPKISFTILVA